MGLTLGSSTLTGISKNSPASPQSTNGASGLRLQRSASSLEPSKR